MTGELDDTLLDVVCERLDADPLPERAEGLLLAAVEGDDALERAVGGETRRRPSAGNSGPAATPAGAYLAGLQVAGFRGIGPAASLTFSPGPGLTLVVGRNGSGKSSFAEALEVLVTGDVRRWADRSAIWREGWRNLHMTGESVIEATLLVEGASGATTLRRAWAAGADFAEAGVSVQVRGESPRGPERLGWQEVATAYRPFLSHSELESMLGKPSELYDLLVAVLGLDDLTRAADSLARSERETAEPLAQAKRSLPELLRDLKALDDDRARSAVHALEADPWDLEGAKQTATGVTAPAPGGELDSLRRLAELAAPDPDVVHGVIGDLRAAAEGLDAVAGTEAERSRKLAELLQIALDHHHEVGDGPCPVCGRPDALGAVWRSTTEAEVKRLQAEARVAEKANTSAASALRAGRAVASDPPHVLEQPVASLDLVPARDAWRAWSELPEAEGSQGFRRLADHLDVHLPRLQAACDQLRHEASAALVEREDRWAPLAARSAAWCEAATSALAAAELVPDLRGARTWLTRAIDDLRNRRLAPLAEQSSRIWAELRQESNVELGAIRLAGSRTRRQVDFDLSVDGRAGPGLGVMSQGEVNALALSVFLPRATLPASPFRFLVIDDPVQAMDPAKVEGLARVLHAAASDRQVVVFTHDDRLPEAVRRLGLAATILEVTRRPGSVVEVRTALEPPARAIEDAKAVAADPAVPEGVVRRVVPGLCRLALEAACTEIVRRKRLGRGDRHADVEDALRAATTLNMKAALALFDDPSRGGEVRGRLRELYGRGAERTYVAANKGAHGHYQGQPGLLADETRRLVEQLRGRQG